ncbi:MAG TPA: hypothetical protein VI386_34560 [Candidatus Sulfotelmatobacter sp.]
MRQRLPLLLVCCGFVLSLFAPLTFAQQAQQKLKAYYAVRPLNASPAAINKAVASSNTLPYWRYNVVSSRDGNAYSGLIVGTDPSTGLSTTVPTEIIPIIFKFPDGTVYDPTAPDPCAGSGSPSDLHLVEQSPMVMNTDFTFGGTDVGKAQYSDAFQRAEFWEASPNGGPGVAANPGYHVRLGYHVLPPVTVNVPMGGGKSWTGLGCGNFGVVNIVWFDPGAVGVSGPDYVLDRVLAPLISKGVVSASNLPVLFMPNVVFAIQSTSPFFNCCILGYHGAYIDGNGNIQTYSPLDFDTTGAFGSAVADTTVMSHEISEWMNDPTGGNPTPAWGHVGQVSGCQGNFETGDALTGTNIPPVTMPNGFSYHLQELVFFSWFYGAPSIAANNWYSDNNTFTSDAGPVCQ